MVDTIIFDYGNTLCKMGSLTESLKAVLHSKQADDIGYSIERSIKDLYIPTQRDQPNWLDVWESAFSQHNQVFKKSIGMKHLNHFVDSGNLFDYTHPLLNKLYEQGSKITRSIASNTLMVGDSEIADIQGANSVGISTMLVAESQNIESSANFVVDRKSIMTELIRVTHQTPSRK